MSEPKTKTGPAKTGRSWTKIALIVSLAVNLLIVGAFAAAMWSTKKPQGRHLERVSMGLGANIAALPETPRSDVLELVNSGRDARRSFRRTMRESQKELDRVLREKPFSEDAVRAAFEQHRGAAVGTSGAIQSAYVDALVAMSDEERDVHLERASELRKERRGKRRKKKWD